MDVSLLGAAAVVRVADPLAQLVQQALRFQRPAKEASQQPGGVSQPVAQEQLRRTCLPSLKGEPPPVGVVDDGTAKQSRGPKDVSAFGGTIILYESTVDRLESQH